MSTLWTPGGEVPIRREQPEPSPSASRPATGPGGGSGSSGGAAPQARRPPGGPDDELGPEDEAALAELQEQLARTPVELVVANHAFGLFELAALHLSAEPPRLDQARLAIDALGALVEGLEGRLGEGESQLREGLANIRMAYVQIRAAAQPAPGSPGPRGGPARS